MKRLVACPLCNFEQTSELCRVSEDRTFLNCEGCGLIFLRPDLRLDVQAEKQRYDLHENDHHDHKYQAFFAPLVKAVKERVVSHSRGLDFGCGPSSAASHLLGRELYKMDLYDPFFYPDKANLKSEYDFIICTEAMEHFFDPAREIEFMRAALKNQCSLFVMTQLWSGKINFANWYYHRDPTHVCFYSEQSLQWIKANWAFSKLEILSENLIVLSA